jgi:DNA-directed RNA polymerase subunit RPC12/RpoP
VAVIKNEVAVYSCMQCNRKIDDLSKASNGWLCDEC